MKKKILWLGLSFLLVAALVLASCGPVEEAGEQVEEEEEVVLPSAQEIIDGVITSLGNIKSHRFDIGMSLEMAGEAEVVETSMATDFSGAMDLENKEMSADATMSLLIPGEDEMEIIMEMYIVGDMAYIKAEMPEMEPMWQKTPMAEEDWGFITGLLAPIESHLDLLELAEVSVIGSEKVKGVECYVLQLIPNLENLWETATQQTAALEMEMPAITEDVLQEVFTNYSVKQWVAKDTYFLIKSEIYISMEVTPEVEEVMWGEGMMTMDIALSFLLYDHNKTLSITLPPEAEEAVEVPNL